MLCLIRLKGCKRCGGDLSLECDIYGVYAECIQCGANWSKTAMLVPASKKSRKDKIAEAPKPLVTTSRKR